MKLYRIRYHYWDDYAFAPSWCSDCPRQEGDGGCCKDSYWGNNDETFWQGAEDFLELAPDWFVIQARLEGRRTPDVFFEGVRVEEVRCHMWQRWRRRDDLNRTCLEQYPGEPCWSDPIITGREYVPRVWLTELYMNDKLGL
jgi:hypothetical protein